MRSKEQHTARVKSKIKSARRKKKEASSSNKIQKSFGVVLDVPALLLLFPGGHSLVQPLKSSSLRGLGDIQRWVAQ